MNKFAIGVLCTVGVVAISKVSYKIGYFKGVFDASMNKFFDIIEYKNDDIVEVVEEEEEES